MLAEVLGFVGFGLYAMFARLALYGWMKRSLPVRHGAFVSTPLVLELQYLRHRKEIGSPRQDFLAATGLISWLPLVYFALLLFRSS